MAPRLASLFLILGATACTPSPTGTGGGTTAATTTPKATTAAGSAAATGARLYNGSCSACHQPGGQGMPNVYPSLAGSPLVLGDPAALARWIVKGERPASMPAGRYAAMMPQFEWLRDEDAAALLTYLRSNFGNAAPAVDAATVAAALGR